MLVLTRRINESLIIGDNIKVKVLKVTKDQIKLGIEAPKDISVHREEIYKKIKLEGSNKYQKKTYSENKQN